MVIRLPKKLPRRATIGIVSPASPQRDVKRLERGIAYLEGMGHTVVCAPNALAVHGGYLAGTQDQRLADLHMMFADKRIDAMKAASKPILEDWQQHNDPVKGLRRALRAVGIFQ